MPAPVIAGAEPFSAAGGDDGVLVLHGFTGSPQTVRNLAGYLASAGFTVELPLLPGHGTAVEDLMACRFDDWAAAADAAYQELAARCERVAVAGLSMGGTLALWLAERHPEVAAVALVNPLVLGAGPELRQGIADLVAAGTQVAPGIGSDIAKEGVSELSYPGTPLAAVLSLFDGADKVAAALGAVQCPVLLFSSRQDHVVEPANGDHLEAEVGGSFERVWLDRSYHVATLDHDADEIDARTVSFLREVLAGNRA